MRCISVSAPPDQKGEVAEDIPMLRYDPELFVKLGQRCVETGESGVGFVGNMGKAPVSCRPSGKGACMAGQPHPAARGLGAFDYTSHPWCFCV